MERRCTRCQVALEAGLLRGDMMPWRWLTEFSFVRPGTQTSWNPVEAFRQGLSDEPGDELIPLSVWRCPQCGLLELAAIREKDDPA